MPRQVISLYKVLPPFEIVSYPETIDIVTKTPSGDELVVTVPVMLFNSEHEYIAHTRESIDVIQSGMVLEKATEVKLVSSETVDKLKTGDIKMEDLDTIEEPPMDEFSMKLQWEGMLLAEKELMGEDQQDSFSDAMQKKTIDKID